MKILVLFVEPMLYGMDLIHEVYERTEYQYRYIYCTNRLTGKDDIQLPDNAFVCHGNNKDHKEQILGAFKGFQPDFAVINGYVGLEQTTAIRYCQKKKIPYAIESDTPLHIPENIIKAKLKKVYLKTLLHNRYCYGFPGGTLQKENLVYYGIPENRNFIMPMSVSSNRMLRASEQYANKFELKRKYGFENKRVFLFVGRLAHEKNIGLLIEAYAKLKKKQPDIALMIVGDGSETERLKQVVNDKRLEDVCFAGYVVFPELVQYYKMADAFVLPSVYEPWGLVINEAMIMGLPVIVSDRVGCRKDLIVEGENGFIFHVLEDLVQGMGSINDIKGENSVIDNWNYKKYLGNFDGIVRKICKGTINGVQQI